MSNRRKQCRSGRFPRQWRRYIRIVDDEAQGTLGPGAALVIQNEGAHMQGLVGLIERLVGRKQNGGAAPVAEGGGHGITEIATGVTDFKMHLFVVGRVWNFGKMECQQSFSMVIRTILSIHVFCNYCIIIA